MTDTLAVVNCSQLVTLAGPRRPRVGAEMRELAVVEGGALLELVGAVARKHRVRVRVHEARRQDAPAALKASVTATSLAAKA